ncbi:GTPase Der [Candidatus Clavichlamydia salmonicola]|uniref:ribosome biogenesis GTPase Der n=1 Tax=Candidatus Clavichlamydia salmonicola TaxID=469812 RepID=UPI0018916FB0|nr:ribosome biogenesis GTPase Der [Candidatus Clavichlamydia salmonicola]MBF5050548.1 GTPase Der [Candidatus Clavichlamydia salmonicola]
MLHIAIVGRPNVGKSSLFNRLCRCSLAIVSEEEGTTRDRLYGDLRCRATTQLKLIDTGGMDRFGTDPFKDGIIYQIRQAVKEADALIFVTDIRCGITVQDQEIAKELLQTDKPVIVAANKAESIHHANRSCEFYGLGFEHVIPISAAHGLGTDNLLDTLEQMIALRNPSTVAVEDPLLNDDSENEFLIDAEDVETLEDNSSTTPSAPIKVALIGSPNVGKSTLINALIGEERCLATNIPGTTRDNLDVPFIFDDIAFTLIDTAGIRRKNVLKSPADHISIVRSEKAISRADICLLVLDTTKGLSEFEKTILNIIEKRGKPSLIIINKWDLNEGTRMEHYLQDLRGFNSFLSHAPTVFVSAKHHKNLHKIFPAVYALHQKVHHKIPTHGFNKLLEEAVCTHYPPFINHRRLRIYFATQTRNYSPVQFNLFVNSASLLTKDYEKYLKRVIREKYNYYGIPFVLKIKEKPKQNKKS